MNSLPAALVSFAAVAAILTVTPGVDSTLVLRTAIGSTRRDAAAAGAGIIVGLTVWASAAAFGISALLTSSQVAYDALRIVGAVYLVVLGARMFARAGRAHDESDDPTDHATAPDEPAAPSGPAPRSDPARSFRTGLLTNLLNPKIGVFYMSLLPQFVPADSSTAAVGLLLGFVHVVETVAWFAVLIAAAHALRSRFERPGFRAAVDRVSGTVLVGFGARLALARN